MGLIDRRLSRRRFLEMTAGVTGAAALGGLAPATRVLAQNTGTFNWMTWNDHFKQSQLDAIAKAAGISTSITPLPTNSDGFSKLKEGGSGLDMISGDALWVSKYFEQGLIDAWDIFELGVAKDLYPLATTFPMWTSPDGLDLGFPFGWSRVDIYYDPAHVSPAPNSWEVLLDTKYVNRVMVENQPEEVSAYMGKLAGAKDVYNLTDDELATVRGYLALLHPNVPKLADQNTDTINALVNGDVWLATGNLGTEQRVLDAGGPKLEVFTPKEGTIGWADAEMIVTGGANTQLIRPFLQLAETPENIAQNFLDNGRPLFNETAYKLLVNNGHGERADRFLYNKPETVYQMTLKGPSGGTKAAIDAFNEVFVTGG